jgi:hypothetical protein
MALCTARGSFRPIADIVDPKLIRKFLDHLNSRAPPPPPVEPRQITPDLFAER